MLLKYVIGTTTFAALCSICWLIMGGTFLSALLVYVVSGQFCMVSLVAFALLRSRSAAAET